MKNYSNQYGEKKKKSMLINVLILTGLKRDPGADS